MANRYPLILDTLDNNKIKELPAGDDLYLRNNSISEVQNITALGNIAAAQLTIAGRSVFAQNFIELAGVPSQYAGAGGAVLKVNAVEDGIEFATLNNFGDLVVDNITMNSDIIPAVNNIGNIGSEDFKFSKIYSTDVYANIRGSDGTLILDAQNNQISYALINGAPSAISEFANDTGFITIDDVRIEVATVLDQLEIGNTDITGSVFGDDSTLLVDGVGNLISTHRLDQVGATNGQVLTWDDNNDRWEPSTPAVTGIALTALSVGAAAAANGSGSVAYNNTTGVFTFTPPDLTSYALVQTLEDYVLDAELPAILSNITLDVVTGNNAITTNNITVGEVTADSITVGGLITDTFTIAGTGIATLSGASNIVIDAAGGAGDIIASGSNITQIGGLSLTPLTAEPTLSAGTIVVADGTNWDPATKSGVVPYPVFYDGVSWNALY
tara:strand:+ start:9042 stop:10364 length:1323 start_codon:yes stop_codon:yes gene_type:complete